MKSIHLILIYLCAILICTSCNENDEIIKEQYGEIHSSSKEITNLSGEDNMSANIKQNAKDSISLYSTKNIRFGSHEEIVNFFDNLQLIIYVQWEAVFDLFVDYNAHAQDIKYADINMSLKDAPYGYWFQIALKGWRFEPPSIVYYGEGQLCRYIEDEEHIQTIGFTVSIEPRYDGYGERFGYSFE